MNDKDYKNSIFYQLAAKIKTYEPTDEERKALQEERRPFLNPERLRRASGFRIAKPYPLAPVAEDFVARSANLNGRNWLYFTGPPGSGKTSQAESVCLRLMWKYPKLFARELSFSSVCRLLVDTRRATPRDYPALFDNLIAGKLVILDDFCSNLPPFQESPEAGMLEEIIDYRYRKRLPTILTTNRSKDNLIRALPDRADPILDRLYEMTNQGKQVIVFDKNAANYRRVS